MAKPRNGLGDIFLAGRSEGRAEEHIPLLEFAVRFEPATTRDEHAIADGSLENVLFDVGACFPGGEARVFLPIDLDPVLNYLLVHIFCFPGWGMEGVTYKHACRRGSPAGNIAWK